MILKLTLKHYF
jgi:hypothetical protein